MNNITQKFQIKRPPIKSGDIVRVHQQIQEGDKKRLQIFEGIVISAKGSGASKTFTVRRVSLGVGVEKTFPLYLPTIKKIEVKKGTHTRRSKLYYLRDLVGKKSRLKEKHLPADVIKMMAEIENEEKQENAEKPGKSKLKSEDKKADNTKNEKKPKESKKDSKQKESKPAEKNSTSKNSEKSDKKTDEKAKAKSSK